MQSVGSVFYVDNFLRGQQDCEAGRPHRDDMGDGYDDGYSAQHTKEQVQAEMSKNVRH